MIPFECSGAPHQEGESATAYRFRLMGFATTRGPLQNPFLPPQEGENHLDRLPDETWVAYMTRAGEPLSGAALAMAENGAEASPEREAAYRAQMEAAEGCPTCKAKRCPTCGGMTCSS